MRTQWMTRWHVGGIVFQVMFLALMASGNALAGTVTYDFTGKAGNNTTTGGFDYSLPNTDGGNLTAHFSVGSPSGDFQVFNGAGNPPQYEQANPFFSGARLRETSGKPVELVVQFSSLLSALTFDFAMDISGANAPNRITADFYNSADLSNRLFHRTAVGVDFSILFNMSDFGVTHANPSKMFDTVVITTSAGSGKLSIDNLTAESIPELDPSTALSAFTLIGLAIAYRKGRRRG